MLPVAIVFTVDQQRSRRDQDRVPITLDRLSWLDPAPTLAFERTAGDEFQGVLEAPDQAVDLLLVLVREGWWSIGVGLGDIDTPLPTSTRAGRGPAYLRARDAVERAKRAPAGLALHGPQPELAEEAEALLTLLALLIGRRSPAGWQAVDLVSAGSTLSEAADTLQVSRQAVSQRLISAGWDAERLARDPAVRLLARADSEETA